MVFGRKKTKVSSVDENIGVLWIKSDSVLDWIPSGELQFHANKLFWRDTVAEMWRCVDTASGGYYFPKMNARAFICNGEEPMSCIWSYEYEEDGSVKYIGDEPALFRSFIALHREKEYEAIAEQYLLKQNALVEMESGIKYATKEDKQFFISNATLAAALLDTSARDYFQSKRTWVEMLPELGLGAFVGIICYHAVYVIGELLAGIG